MEEMRTKDAHSFAIESAFVTKPPQTSSTSTHQRPRTPGPISKYEGEIPSTHSDDLLNFNGKLNDRLILSAKPSTSQETQPVVIDKVQSMKRLSKLIDPTPKSLAQRVTHLIRSALHGNETFKNGEWSKAYKRLLQFKNAIEEKKKHPGARVYERRLYDIVVDSKYPTLSPKRKEQMPDILVSAYNLIDSLGGKHAQKQSMNFKFLSPRFAPLMPDKIDAQSRHLSPSIFAFYKDNSVDNIASVPKVCSEI
ncbi:unnamed protein product [Toxocara canis]|uniref:KIX_2 domain-containing protein n=1 Tax=Toxocara canis TaxID=6265 RepID=A0A183UR02_TOXCA|nr:unnamed protein product [Toxocara canis]